MAGTNGPEFIPGGGVRFHGVEVLKLLSNRTVMGAHCPVEPSQQLLVCRSLGRRGRRAFGHFLSPLGSSLGGGKGKLIHIINNKSSRGSGPTAHGRSWGSPSLVSKSATQTWVSDRIQPEVQTWLKRSLGFLATDREPQSGPPCGGYVELVPGRAGLYSHPFTHSVCPLVHFTNTQRVSALR